MFFSGGFAPRCFCRALYSISFLQVEFLLLLSLIWASARLNSFSRPKAVGSGLVLETYSAPYWIIKSYAIDRKLEDMVNCEKV